MPSFLVTITSATGLTEPQMIAFEEWVDQLDVDCVVAREQHKSGLWHIHAIMVDGNKQAAGLRRKIIRLHGSRFDFSSKRALDVKLVKPGEEERTAGYVCKDQEVYVHRGWSIKALLDKRAVRLEGQVDAKPVATFMFNEKNCEEIILEYAKLKGLPLTCKEEFLDVVVAMGVDGYSVSRIKPCLVYAQVMARAGSPKYLRDWWEMKLGAQM